jgi:hypothetical protein
MVIKLIPLPILLRSGVVDWILFDCTLSVSAHITTGAECVE